MAGLCKHHNETSGYVKERKYFDKLNYNHVFKDNSAFMGIGGF